MTNVLNAEKPDLVILSGDQISDYEEGFPNPKPRDWVYKHWGYALWPLQKLGYRWATIMGNHDYGIQMSSDDIMSFDASHDGSYTKATNDTGYYLDILSQDGTSVASRVWLFQTGRAGMSMRHVDWYQSKSLELRERDFGAQSIPTLYENGTLLNETIVQSIPSIGFMHIPLKEYLEVYNSGEFRGVMEDRDGICCQTASEHDFFDRSLLLNELKVISSGHDHGNTFMGELDGIHLGYGLKTSVGGYAVPVHGARVFVISTNPSQSPDSQVGALLYQQPVFSTTEKAKTAKQRPSATKKGYSQTIDVPFLTIHSYLRTSNGSVDEQLSLGSSPPEHLLTKCCVGLPKPSLLPFIIAVTCLGVLLIAAVIVVARFRVSTPLGQQRFPLLYRIASCGKKDDDDLLRESTASEVSSENQV